MSKLKMSDVFGLPVENECDCEVWDGGGEIIAELQISNTANHVVEAINAYDSNQELIAKQAERIEGQLKLLRVAGKRIAGLEDVESKLQADNELLREALGEILEFAIYANNVLGQEFGDYSWDESMIKAKKMLAATTDGDDK